MITMDEFDGLVETAARRPLTQDEASAAMAVMAEGAADGERIRALLETPAMAVETVTASTLAGLAREVRARAISVPGIDGIPVVDTCGTGGGASTFNVSTAAAFVVASVHGPGAALASRVVRGAEILGAPGHAACSGARLAVAKHGNRAVASRCGSADVLEELGIRIELEPQEAAELMARLGFAFFFAPRYHRAFAHVMPVRRALAARGYRTAFNLVGPLANPAAATHQVVGVFSPDRLKVVAETLSLLGSRAALVVSGRSGDGDVLDEISTGGETAAIRVGEGGLEEITLTPESFGRRPVREVGMVAEDRKASARLVLSVLEGTAPEAAMMAVELNAAAALSLAFDIAFGPAADLSRELLQSGAARATLEAVRTAVGSAHVPD